MTSQLNAANRVALRALLRSAAEFDRAPLLKALVTRNPDVHSRMQPDMHSVIATYLGSELRTHFVPSRVLPHSMREAVSMMFRFPPASCNANSPFSCMRYLDSVLQVGRRHGLVSDQAHVVTADAQHTISDGSNGAAVSSMYASRPELLPLPEPGCILLAHPLMKGGGEAGDHLAGRTAFSFAQSAILVCGHSTSLGAYGLCLNKPLPVKAGALALGSPLTRALVGELFSWPQVESESSKELLRRWQTLLELHRQDPELGFREQIEAADTLDADPYARLRLLLLEKGWFGEAAAAAASATAVGDCAGSTDETNASGSSPAEAASAGAAGEGRGTTESAKTEAAQSSPTDDVAAPGRPGGGAGSASSSAPGAPVLHWLGGGAARRTATAGAVAEHYAAQKTAEGAAPSDSSPEAAPPAAAAAPVRADASAAALGVTAAQGAAAANAPGGPDTEAMAAADVPAAEAAPKTGGEAAVAAEGQRGRPASETTEASADADPKLSGQKAASVRQDRSWDGMLMRFAESSLSKGGPLPSLQVLHRHARLGGQQVLPAAAPDGGSALYLGTSVESLEQADPAPAADAFVVGNAMWQPTAQPPKPSLVFPGTSVDTLEQEDPALAADMHFFVGDAMWQPGQLEGEVAAGAWLAVPPPAALRSHSSSDKQETRRLGGLWASALRELGGPYVQLAKIDTAVVEDLQRIEL